MTPAPPLLIGLDWMKTDPLSVLRPLRIRVWLTRLNGLSDERFDELATVIRRMNRINLAELTPLLNPTSITSLFCLIYDLIRRVFEANWWEGLYLLGVC